MSGRVTIVMYHFVRDLAGSRYPRIKGLDSKEFEGQLGYIARHYDVVSIEAVIDAVDGGSELPGRPLLLTFDDGYADHYQTVFPLLDKLGLPGAFYPPARAILERSVLDVNKIHFLLAANADVRGLVGTMEALMDEARETHDLAPLEWYRAEYAHANRWDPPEVIYVKRVLQRGLPEDLRARITDRLFQEYVSDNEVAFANELYMTLEQLECMRRHGMHIGSHSYDHYWLDTLNPTEQETQVLKSVEFLRRIGCDMRYWTMCYPYGGYNGSLVEILQRNGCRLGLGTNVDIARLDGEERYWMSRLDTNDLPKTGGAQQNDWTRSA